MACTGRVRPHDGHLDPTTRVVAGLTRIRSPAVGDTLGKHATGHCCSTLTLLVHPSHLDALRPVVLRVHDLCRHDPAPYVGYVIYTESLNLVSRPVADRLSLPQVTRSFITSCSGLFSSPSHWRSSSCTESNTSTGRGFSLFRTSCTTMALDSALARTAKGSAFLLWTLSPAKRRSRSVVVREAGLGRLRWVRRGGSTDDLSLYFFFGRFWMLLCVWTTPSYLVR